MAARNTITIEFVGDTARLVRSSGQASDAISSDMRDAATDASKSADTMADRFEKAFDGIHGRVGTKVGPGFASLGGSLGGKLLGGFAALGIGSVIADQLGAAMDISAGVDKLEARLGLTAKEAGRLGDLAGETYAGAWSESMEEVEGFYAETMRAFPKLTDEALQKVTESAATTADVWDQDFNEVVRAAQNLLTNGLAPDAQTAMDMVATALQKTKGPQDEVLQSLMEYSDHFAVLGLDGANILGGLTSEWATNQYAIDKVGDAIKELAIRTVDGSDTTKEGLKVIGLSVGEVETAFAKGGETAKAMTEKIITGILGIEDPAERARVGVKLMGTPFEDLGNNAVPILKDVVEGQKDLTDTIETGNVAYDNAKTKIESFRRQGLQKLTNFIGGTVIPAFEDDLLPTISDAADAIGGDAKQISNRVARHLGVEVPDTLSASGREWKGYANQIEEARVDGVKSFRDLTSLIQDRSLTFGDKFGIIWSDIWSANTRTEQRNLDKMAAAGDLFQTAQRGDWRGFGTALNTIVGDAWSNIRSTIGDRMKAIGNNLSVQHFVLRLMWSNFVEAVSKRVREWGSNFVEWWRKLPTRITDALGNIGKRIKDAFMDVLGKGLSIPIKLLFGGDGLGIGVAPGTGGGGLLGISPFSAVGRAYTSMGRPGDVISGYRPGARTLSGALSYHAQGRALDITPQLGIALAIRNLFKAATKELITPWPWLNVHNGSNYRYSDSVQAQHDGRTNVRHIHWAMREGGYGTLTQPTMLHILAGEAGAEDFAFVPHSKGGMARASVTPVVNVHVTAYLDGEQVLTDRIHTVVDAREEHSFVRSVMGG